MNKLLLAVLTSTLFACASTESESTEIGEVAEAHPSMPPEANRMQPDHLPTPFSAQQIQMACSENSYRQYNVTNGPMEMQQRFLFQKDDGTGAAFQVIWLDKEGAEEKRQNMPSTSWRNFQSHASYPIDGTSVVYEQVTVEAGTFDCWTYTSQNEAGIVNRISFALILPGPPLLATAAEEDGTLVSSMELTGYGME
jgi:hypothetical protein